MLRLSDLLLNDAWNFNLLHNIFGAFLSLDFLTINKCSYSSINKWVWYPKARNFKKTFMGYTYFNNSAGNLNPWDGWGNIWRLKIAPWPKHFLWLILHNGIKT